VISRVVIGLDPGVANCGYSVLDFPGRRPVILACGCWKTEPEFSTDDRIHELMANLGVSFEAWTYNRSIGAIYSVVPRVCEAIKHTCAMRPIPCVSVTTTQAKRALGLVGKCSKDRVRRMVLACTDGERPKNEHSVDAVAVAVAGMRELRKRRAA
jgi:crossover junction endodeoxyribonuclease RuvC